MQTNHCWAAKGATTMFIEGFLIKIAAAVIKKAMATKLVAFATAFEIFSIFDAVVNSAEYVSAANDCHALGVFAFHVASDPLINTAVDRLLSAGNMTFEVQQTKSGVYVASHLVPRFAAPRLIIPTHLKSTALTHTLLKHKRLPHRLFS